MNEYLLRGIGKERDPRKVALALTRTDTAIECHTILDNLGDRGRENFRRWLGLMLELEAATMAVNATAKTPGSPPIVVVDGNGQVIAEDARAVEPHQLVDTVINGATHE